MSKSDINDFSDVSTLTETDSSQNKPEYYVRWNSIVQIVTSVVGAITTILTVYMAGR